MEYVSPTTCLKLSYVAKLCDSPSLSEIFVIFAVYAVKPKKPVSAPVPK